MKSRLHLPTGLSQFTVGYLPVSSTLKLKTEKTTRSQFLVWLGLCFLIVAQAIVVAAQPKKSTITIISPKIPAQKSLVSTGGLVNLRFAVSDPEIVVVVLRFGTALEPASVRVPMVPTETSYLRIVPLVHGTNTIELNGLKKNTEAALGQDKAANAVLTIECYEFCAPVPYPIAPGVEKAVVASPDTGVETATPKKDGNISILHPSPGKAPSGLFDSVITVKKSDIKRLLILVKNGGKIVEQPESELTVKATGETTVLTPKLHVTSGENIITVLNLDDPVDKQAQASVTVTCDAPCTAPASVAQAIRIDIPEGGKELQDATYVNSQITVKNDSNISRLFVRVLNNGKPLGSPLDKTIAPDGESLAVNPDPSKSETVLKPRIKIGKGTNVITVFDASKDIENSPQDSTEITCAGEKCGGQAKNIVVITPESSTTVPQSFIDSYIAVTRASGISEVVYRVFNGENVVFTSKRFPVGEIPADKPGKTFRVPIQVLAGTNRVEFYNALKPGEEEASILLNCEGSKCVSDFLVSTIVTNSENTRVVVGLEQAGASSASSETKPFLDFFFTAPFLFNRSEVPRLAAWGQIRLASTPDQITAIGILPTNLVNQVGQSGGTGGLVQSFDFLAGLEGRIGTANGSFLSLIPGVRQKTHFYIAVGGGAISPLTAKRENAQIYRIPLPNSPQFQPFIDRYGTPPAATADRPAKEFVAFVPLERDRFLRQWYMGVRLKTSYCEDEDCTRFRNHFPGILDVMFGQNEAVTGGRLKYLERNDPADNTKITGQKRAFVVRVDAYYPLPFREASFLYLYGSAMMKIGGPGVQINNPIFLDPGSILITDPKVYIPPSELQQLLQPDRDYYKIGVGVNLTELFNRNKTPSQ